MNKTHETLQKIVSYYNQRDLKNAESLCQLILDEDPENPDANHFYGIIAWESGDLETAKTYIEKAISLGIKKIGFADHAPLLFQPNYSIKVRDITMDLNQLDTYYSIHQLFY